MNDLQRPQFELEMHGIESPEACMLLRHYVS
jgi:hypothetical protein